MLPFHSFEYMIHAVVSWRRLLMHAVRLALSRALPSAGSRMPISTAMMPMTTSSSTSVNAFFFCRFMIDSNLLEPEKLLVTASETEPAHPSAGVGHRRSSLGGSCSGLLTVRCPGLDSPNEPGGASDSSY